MENINQLIKEHFLLKQKRAELQKEEKKLRDYIVNHMKKANITKMEANSFIVNITSSRGGLDLKAIEAAFPELYKTIDERYRRDPIERYTVKINPKAIEKLTA